MALKSGAHTGVPSGNVAGMLPAGHVSVSVAPAPKAYPPGSKGLMQVENLNMLMSLPAHMSFCVSWYSAYICISCLSSFSIANKVALICS